MGVTAADYLFVPFYRTVVPGAGVSRATAVITRHSLFILPHVSIRGGGTTITRTTQTLGGDSPADAIAALVAEPGLTPDALEAQLQQWTTSFQGGLVKPLAAYRRIKIRKVLCGRSLMLSEKDTGFDMGGNLGTVKSMSLTPAEFAQAQAFFAGDPRLQ